MESTRFHCIECVTCVLGKKKRKMATKFTSYTMLVIFKLNIFLYIFEGIVAVKVNTFLRE